MVLVLVSTSSAAIISSDNVKKKKKLKNTPAIVAETDMDLHKIIWTTFSRSRIIAGHSCGLLTAL